MSITYNEQKKIISLHTKNSTYQMMIDNYGFLLHLYYGKKTKGDMSVLLVKCDRGFSGNPFEAGSDRTYSMDFLPSEFPCRNSGDYRSPVIDIKYSDGSFGCDLRYAGHTISKGKYSIPGLPAVYAKETESETLSVVLKDKESDAEVTLFYGVLEDSDIITRAAKVTNKGKSVIHIEKLQSACLDFISGDYDLLTFYGRHAMERNLSRTNVGHVSSQITSRRGTSSHQQNPFMILADKNTTEDYGNCYAMSFVYSGGFLGEVEKDQVDQTRMQLGLAAEHFSYPLGANEEIWAPEVIMTYSGDGFSLLSSNLHECIKNHVCRGKYKNTVRPILVNSWEASYFNINKESIVGLAKNAAKLGVEMLVMDDGWFGKRDDDNSGLGDWIVNEKKLGCTLKELIDAVNETGLKFGIWIEPEMINMDSDLYRKHPDWAFARPGCKPIRARNQLVLDFSRKEIVDYIFDSICNVMDQGNIEYIKWDMNRSITNVFSNGTDAVQGKVMYNYMLGVYDFLERLITKYPDILIEGCSGGGGRFDAGMLYYTQQIWCSDNTDAIDRTRIQYGTSFAYPLITMGSHVSASPNHQTGRSVSMNTRGVVAMAGSFGYELDFGKLSQAETEEIKEQIAFYKKHANTIYTGRYYRLSNPFEDSYCAWQINSKDGRHILLNIVFLEKHANTIPVFVKLKGLTPNKMYRLNGVEYSTEALMEVGMPLLSGMSEYEAKTFEIEEI